MLGMNTPMEFNGFPIQRPRRARLHAALREMLVQTRLAPSDFVAPLFVRVGTGLRRPIASMPGVCQFSPDTALEELKRLQDLGIRSFILFGVTDAADKSPTGVHAHDPENAVCQTLRKARMADLGMLAITDLCYCEYTSHGHCGPLTKAGKGGLGGGMVQTVDNDATVAQLAEQAVVHAEAGADMVAPSGMMDGAVGAIRAGLDGANFQQVSIMGYSVKYASAFYGPFRDAAESPPQFGDRKSYQMDFRRGSQEAIREAQLDISEGADVVMVKPGLAYLDILQQVSQRVEVPTAVYQVSGEYAMIKAAAERGWIDEKSIVLETMYAFKRAGASFILTYYAGELAGWLKG